MTGGRVPGENTVLDGRYRLLERLASGGMAVVWVARDERLDREVAIKILSDVLAADEAYRRRFEREARVAASLNHPALVGVLDFGTESERPYLVMELIRGDTLARRISARTTSMLDVRTLAIDLLGALAHIHAAGIVHRDIKPANVLISGDGRARLTDFGIARPADATALTQPGQVVGTLRYMAPETQRGEPATARSDLYSLGMVLRECGGEQDAELAPVISWLAADDPGDRPRSAEEALARLAETTSTSPTPATEPTARLGDTAATARLPRTGSDQPRRDRRLRVGPAAAVAVLALLAAVVLALALTGGRDDPRSTSRPASDAARNRDSPSRENSEPAPAPAPDDPLSEPAATDSCAAIEEEKKALEEQKKAAEQTAGDDKDAKEAIKADFEARKKALQERAKECR